MWKENIFLLSAICTFYLLLVLFSPPCRAQTAKHGKWREDLNYMVKELEIRHANLYHKISPDTFKKAKAKLEDEIPKLTDNQIIVEFARLAAMIGEGHTGVFLPWDRQNGFRKYPIEIWVGSDGLIILAASPKYSDLIGAKIIRIENTDIYDVKRAISPLIPRDNEFGFNALLPHYIRIPELLHVLGFVKDMERLTLTIEDAQNRMRQVTIQPLEAGTNAQLRLIDDAGTLPLWLRKRTDAYWFEYLEDSKTAYLQYNDASIDKKEEAFSNFCERVRKYIENHEVKQLIIDLRWNDGGSIERAQSLVKTVIRSDKINQPGKLFTIISPITFSTGTLLAVDLERYTKTLFVGEPTGGKPNSFGFLMRFRLPNSKLEVRYAAWHQNRSTQGDTRPAIMPHLKAAFSSKDYRNSVDPALNVIAAYKPKQSILFLKEIVGKDGVPAAVAQYRKLKGEHYNEYDFSEDELNRLGYSFLQSNQFDAAIAFFELYVEEFPYSGNAYDSLGEAYMKAGKRLLAIENFKRAFALDKRFVNFLENMRKHQ